MYLNKVDEINDLIGRGQLNLDQLKYVQSKIYFEKALEIDPNCLDARLGLIRIKFEFENEVTALKDLEEVVLQNNAIPTPLLLKGELNARYYEYDIARECFSAAIPKCQTDSERLYCYIMIYWTDGDYEGMVVTKKRMIELNVVNYLAEYYLEHLNHEINRTIDMQVLNRLIQKHPFDYRLYELTGKFKYIINEYSNAYENYKKTIEYLPPTVKGKLVAECYKNLALSCAQLKNNDEALHSINKSIQQFPDIRYTGSRAVVNHLLANYSDAIKDYTICIDNDYCIEDSRYNRGMNYIANGDYEEAKIDFEVLLKNDPNDVNALEAMALYYKRLNDYSNSKKYYDMVLAIDPKNYSIRNDLSRILYEENDYKNAAFHLEILAQVENTNPVFTLIGICYFRLERHSDAIKWFTKALEIDREDSSTYSLRGLVRNIISDDGCLEDFNKAILYDNSSPDGYYGKGKVFYQQKEYEKALEYFSIAISKKDDYGSYLSRGECYYHLKKYEKSIEDYDKAFELDDSFPDPLLFKLVSLINNDKYDDSLNSIEMMIDKFPDIAETYYFYGLYKYHKRVGDFGRSEFNKAKILDNSLFLIYAALADIEEDEGNYEEALRQYEIALKYGEDDALKEILRLKAFIKNDCEKPVKVSTKEIISEVIKTELKGKVKIGETIKGTLRNQILITLKKKHNIEMKENALRSYLSDLDYVRIRQND